MTRRRYGAAYDNAGFNFSDAIHFRGDAELTVNQSCRRLCSVGLSKTIRHPGLTQSISRRPRELRQLAHGSDSRRRIYEFRFFAVIRAHRGKNIDASDQFCQEYEGLYAAGYCFGEHTECGRKRLG